MNLYRLLAYLLATAMILIFVMVMSTFNAAAWNTAAQLSIVVGITISALMLLAALNFAIKKGWE